MTLFFNEEEAIEELKSRGYRITKEVYPEAQVVRTMKDLVDFFYSRRRFYNPDRKFPYSIDYSEDAKKVSMFVRSRQKLGLGRKTAIAEAAALIDALFKFEKQLHLKEPIISPGILSSQSIMDKICSYLNGEVAEVSEVDNELYVAEINKYYDKKCVQQDLERADATRRKILERLDDNSAKRK